MGARSIADSDVASLYAAHRLTLVRLAVLLVDDRAGAEQLVQDAFLRLQRGRGRDDPGATLGWLEATVVDASRRRARLRAREIREVGAVTTGDRIRLLPRLQREALVLTLWAGHSNRRAGGVLSVGERVVAQAVSDGLATVGPTGRLTGDARLDADDQGDRDARLRERVEEALHRRADSVTATDLRTTFADVLDEDARRTAAHRRRWLAVVAGLVVVALVAAVTTLLGRRTPQATPAPPPSATTAPPEALSSPALAPDEKPRSAIPWDQVGPGWTVLATGTPATAVTTTVLLVSPNGIRYPVGSAPAPIVVQDVSRDGRRVLLSVDSQPQEWDLADGTSRSLGVTYGWKTMRYAGTPASGYLVLWTDPSSTVRMDHWGADGRLLASFPFALPPTAGSPGTPGLVIDRASNRAVVDTIDDNLKVVDLAADAVYSLPLPTDTTRCTPRSSWSRGEVLLDCAGTVTGLVASALDGSSAASVADAGLSDAWATPIGSTVLRAEGTCSTGLSVRAPNDGTVTAVRLPEAAGLVPNTVVDGVVYFGGTRCPDDGDHVVAYDLGSGKAVLLGGPDAGGRTVRQAVVVTSGG